ncbi:hypothetical protein TWF481_002834 [Arthrobotrys musiformis]|uniref:Uncharacterized protein n=1 Tax=Arthrobotrys musiformis TaxID=47236 RepID=A0AAV9VRJ7_9PEZI
MAPIWWVCFDTGAGLPIIDIHFLRKLWPLAYDSMKKETLKIKGIGDKTLAVMGFATITLYLPSLNGTDVAEITREFHVVEGLGIPMLYGGEAITSGGLVFNPRTMMIQCTHHGDILTPARMDLKRRLPPTPTPKPKIPPQEEIKHAKSRHAGSTEKSPNPRLTERSHHAKIPVNINTKDITPEQ